VELDLTTGDETFRSTTVVRFSSTEPGARTFIDLAAPSVRSAVLNGRELDPAELFDGERLVLPEVAAENDDVIGLLNASRAEGETKRERSSAEVPAPTRELVTPGLHQALTRVPGGLSNVPPVPSRANWR
jgi:hypothetical protein